VKILRLISVLSFLSVFLVACSKQTPEPITYTIEMSEFAFTPNTIEAKIGQQVTIELINKGTLEHEIMFGRDVMMVNNRPDNFKTDMFGMAQVEPKVMQDQMSDTGESMHGADHTGFMVVLPKTDSKATISFTVTEEMQGEWEIGCFSQNGVHFDAGMKGKFIVNP
jgi:plastocyanin